MFKKLVVCGLIANMFLLPSTVLAASHHHGSHHRPPRYEHRERYRPRYRHHHSRSMHGRDYAVVAAGVILGAILANKL